MRYSRGAGVAVLATIPAAAGAQAVPDAPPPPPPITVAGSVALVSDYRFRGVSQSDRKMTVQGGITVTHDSGAHGGLWGSNLAGWGTFGGANLELDLVAGYAARLGGGATLDGGVTWYVYPGGARRTAFAEPYAKLSGTAGAATLTAGAAYAPPQQAIGRWYDDGAAAASGRYDHRGASDDNLYLWGDGAIAIAGTPLTARAHIGHSRGQDGLGPNATALAPTGSYWDWSVGIDAAWRGLTVSLGWADTDIARRDAARLQPAFSTGQDGTGSIAGGTLVASLGASF
jgi:uncharacterized protein (TIGR02001 family)